jgi:uncharacterized damage-inducible protein DinB
MSVFDIIVRTRFPFFLFCFPKIYSMKKMISTTFCSMALMFGLFSFQANAQALTEEDIKAQMVKEWERAKAFTVDYLNTMPADKYSFKAMDSVRSFAQQMLHLAQGNLFLMSNATDQKPPAFLQADLEHSTTAGTKDSVMYYVTSSYDYCINVVKTSDINKWGEKKKLFSYEETRFALMMKTFEHQAHHRGQATIYIRLVGVKPPNEKLF